MITYRSQSIQRCFTIPSADSTNHQSAHRLLNQNNHKASQTESSEIPKVEGLDTKDGLTRVGGNRTLYLKLLRQFLTQQAPAAVQIAEALAANDSLLAERLAHTVKGVAGNLGARELQQVSGTLEKAIANKTSTVVLEETCKNFASVLDGFVSRLRCCPSAAKSVTTFR